MPEFTLIEIIRRMSLGRPDVRLGIGDDAAVLRCRRDRNWWQARIPW
jgi:thiamine monophosphate kinase